MYGKRWIAVLLMIVMYMGLAACNIEPTISADAGQSQTSEEGQQDINEGEQQKANESDQQEVREADQVASGNDQPETERQEGDSMRIRVATNNSEIVFALNETSAAKSLYEQLPITVDVENYSNNEKIFYADKLDCTDVIEGSCPTGTLAYFSPWGNVVMYYGPAPSYPGLYILGEAVEGADNIRNLSGKLEITKVEE